ncbi:MAG: hypothetical protein AAGD11_18825, partial [Planctomycetota bacterium]
MKTKLKSGNAIVRLLLAHGEKIGILAILVCTGLIVWSAMGRERLGREPSQLKNVAKDARSNMVRATWKQLADEGVEPGEDSAIVMARALPPTAMVKISADNFPNFSGNFNPPVADPVTFRTDPVLLAIADLEVNSDSGLWASADPDTIRQKMLDAEKERLEQEREREAARKRAEREGEGRRGGPGGYGGEGYGGGRGGFGPTGRDGKVSRDAPIVQRPRGGAQLQGFEDIREKSWVTVLAKLPIKQQTDIYNEALEKSRGYNKRVDFPQYLGYQVERAEVTSAGQGDWERIKFVKKSSLEEEISTYPVNVPDVIDKKVNHPLLTHPLPPLILHEWGERVSHSSMPLAEEVARQKMMEMEEAEDAEDDAESKEDVAGEDDLFADTMTARERARSTGGAGTRRGYGGEGGYGRGGGGEFGGYGGEGGYGGGEFGGRGGYGGEGGYGGGEFGGRGGYGGEGGYGGGEFGGRGGFGGMRGSLGRGSDVQIPEFVWDQETEHVLFRYFDNTAKPGHSYRYRVRLAMVDVNHGVAVQHLDKSVTTRREESGNKNYRWTDWSEPSPIASVPMPARVYLVNTKPVKAGAVTS